ncbi:MAG: hypothetical protein ABR540_18210, partial [Acidimicrobiales bacterium]
MAAPTSVALAAFHLLLTVAFALPAALASMYLYGLAAREVAEIEGSRGLIRRSFYASVVQQQLLG